MLKNYAKIALRNLFRHSGYSLINILGLAIGMGCCILILLLVQSELGFDTHHEKANRIYRVLREVRTTGASSNTYTGTSGALSGALLETYPEVEQAARMMNFGVYVRYEVGDRGFRQNFASVDPSVFEIFTLPFVKGDPEVALDRPGTAVLSEEMAEKFFADENPIGKIITVDFRYFAGEYTITGVLRDTPRASSIRIDFLTTTVAEFPSRFWDEWALESTFFPAQNYILLRKDADPAALERKLVSFAEQKLGPELAALNTYYLQPLTRIHLYSTSDYGISSTTDISTIKLYISIGGFILLLACINFMNLATARSASRAREVGLRKVSGALRRQIVGQFLGESILFSILAMLFAVLFAWLAMPSFNALVGRSLVIEQGDLLVMGAMLLAMAVSVGIVSGSYPAFFLSAFQPVSVLKGTSRLGSRSWLRKVLVVFQFGVSITLIVGAMTVYDQMNYLRSQNLGFDYTHLLRLPVFATDRSLTDRYGTVKDAFLRHPDILKASASHSTAAGIFERMFVQPEGYPPDEWQIPIMGIDEDFLDTYGIPIVKGRNLTTSRSDSSDAFLLNETAVRLFGWDDPERRSGTGPIGKRFAWPRWERYGTVVGVVKDFHFRSLRESVGPLAVCKWQDKFNNLTLRISGNDVPGTLEFLQKTWDEFLPGQPFRYQFITEYLEFYYSEDVRLGRIFNTFAALAIFVASLGLFGLASFTAEQRTKEIGIRKSLGASVPGIVSLLSREFLILVGIAILIAWPLAWIGMNRWLEEFVIRIALGPAIFILSSLSALVIAQFTVSLHAIRAATGKPIDALRYE